MKQYRIVFSKKGSIRFVGHLDLMEVFRRAVKRAKIPVKYTSGFNPHMDFGIAMPLSLGMEGLAEYADITLTQEFCAESLKKLLNRSFPDGLNAVDAYELPPGSKSAASLISMAEYTAVLPANFEIEKVLKENIKNFSQKTEILILKKTKSGEKMTNIKNDIRHIELIPEGEITVKMTLSAGSANNLKPDIVMSYLLENKIGNIYIRYTREKLIFSQPINKGNV